MYQINFSDFFDLCLHWLFRLSVVRASNNKCTMGHFLWSSHNIWTLLFMIWTWKKAFIQIGKKSYNFIRQEEMSVAVSASILQQGVCQNFIHFSFLFVNLKSNINVSKSKHDLTRRSSYSGSSEGVKIWGCQYYSVGIICPPRLR